MLNIDQLDCLIIANEMIVWMSDMQQTAQNLFWVFTWHYQVSYYGMVLQAYRLNG